MSLQKSADLTASRSEVENIGEDKQTQDTANHSPVTFVGVSLLLWLSFFKVTEGRAHML